MVVASVPGVAQASCLRRFGVEAQTVGRDDDNRPRAQVLRFGSMRFFPSSSVSDA